MKYSPLETHAELRNAKCYKNNQFLLWLYQNVLIPVCLTTQYMYGFFPLIVYLLFYYTILLYFQLSTVIILELPQMVDALALVTTYNSVVTYTCNTGYTRQGSNRRTCQSNGLWSGSLPRCNRKFCFVLKVFYIIVSIYILSLFPDIYIYILYILTAPVRIVALAQQVTHRFHC